MLEAKILPHGIRSIVYLTSCQEDGVSANFGWPKGLKIGESGLNHLTAYTQEHTQHGDIKAQHLVEERCLLLKIRAIN